MEIKNTKLYDKFKVVRGNRQVNKRHLQNLIVSISEVDLLEANPIIVNEKMEVIDGQHRLEAAKQLGKTIYYVVANSTKLDDVQLLNSTARLWGMADYLESYIVKGNQEYEKLKTFMEKWDLPLGVALRLLSTQGMFRRSHKVYGEFRHGDFVATAEAEGTKVAQVIRDYRRYLEDGETGRDKGFLEAILYMYRKAPVKHEDMMGMFEVSGWRIGNLGSIRNYLRRFEEVFNYHKQEKGSVRFF